MSKLKISAVLISIIGSIFFAGCETEVDIIAPKRDVTIVYGLLEANKTTHYIRINRSFVGADSASVLAAQAGANEYSDDEIIEAVVREVNENGNITRTFSLQSTYVYSKENGTFFSDSNKVYYFNANLDVSKNYELFLRIKPEGEEEKEVTALTNILGSADGSELLVTKPVLTKPCGSIGVDRDAGEVDWVRNGTYRTAWSLKWSASQNASSYTSYARLYYRDVYPDGSIFRDSVLIPMGIEKVTPTTNQGEVEFVVSPAEMYVTIGRNIADYDFNNDEFVRVVNDTLDFYLEVANSELATYIEINQPTTDVVQEKPQYTNVLNGIGLFASRYVTSTKRNDLTCSGRILDAASLEELLYSNAISSSEATGKKNFTNPRCSSGKCK